MIPEAVISHSTPGRLRVKVPSRKGDAAYFTSLKDRFTQLKGVKQVETNAVTGSAVLIYDGEVKDIAAFAAEQTLFTLNSKPQTTALSRNVVKTFSDLDHKIKRFTGDELDTAGLAFATLLGFGIYEIGRGNFAAPAWYTAFWYAFNIFLKSLPDSNSGTNK